MSINKVIVSGNLTRDPELRMAGSTPLLQMGIAVNDRKKNNTTGDWEDVPNFFDVIVWGARGEALSRFLQKGSKVVVSGRLRWSQWQNKEGENRSKVEIVAEDVEFLSPRDGSGGGSNSQFAAPSAPSGSGNSFDAPAAPSGDADVFTDDIPFF